MARRFANASSFGQDLVCWCTPRLQPSSPILFSNYSSMIEEDLPIWGTCPSTGCRIKALPPSLDVPQLQDVTSESPFSNNSVPTCVGNSTCGPPVGGPNALTPFVLGSGAITIAALTAALTLINCLACFAGCQCLD
eukprot:TRINITY_DN10730_c0_g1_i1.p1 TRINITY_DN10730_c0_g1~~TRINITY_DN10730_c0_g1_i1.p1  ORF type:complete len:136 (-),score=5.75 TRINITY_DN10730_c0_g1_i1:9-416(-)